jgi:hypothetical protein
MTGGASASSSGLWSIIVLGMDPDGPRIGKFFVFAMAGETESIVMVGFDELGSTRSSMGIVTVKTENPGNIVAALLKVKPLLVVGFRMGLRISPTAGLELVIVRQGLA